MIDLKRYPLDNPDKTHHLIMQCQEDLNRTGACLLKGFIDSSLLPQMVSEVTNLQSWHRKWPVTAYHSHGKVSEADTILAMHSNDNNHAHPRFRLWRQDVHAVANINIPHHALLKRIYQSTMIKEFLAAVLNKPALYEYADEMQCLNVMYMKDGGERAWHYDKSDCVVTILLQSPEYGGQFEYAPFIRGNGKINAAHECENEHYADVNALFEGRQPRVNVEQLETHEGDMLIFNGMRSLHRVTRVRGPTERIIAVLSYDTKPAEEQTLPSEEVNEMMYGPRKTQKAHRAQSQSEN